MRKIQRTPFKTELIFWRVCPPTSDNLVKFQSDPLIDTAEYLKLPWHFFTKIITEKPSSKMPIIKLLRQIY